MVSEITRFYCKPDMTSSWFLHLGAPQMIIQDAFWNSEHDFLIAIESNFLCVIHGFRDNEVLLQARYDVIMMSSLGGASGEFSWRILEEDFLIAFHTNFLSRMHDFRDNEVSLCHVLRPAGHERWLPRFLLQLTPLEVGLHALVQRETRRSFLELCTIINIIINTT